MPNNNIAIGVFLHRLYLALLSCFMIMVWLAFDHVLFPLADSLPIAFMFAFWVLVAPWFIQKRGIQFLSFDILETADSRLHFSRGNSWRYLLSLHGLNPQQLYLIPLRQIMLNMAFGGIYFLLSRSDVSVFITLPIATLGGYLTARSLCFSICLVFTIIAETMGSEFRGK
ncbi:MULTISPECIES: hypothetical protein [Acinetobacter]|uniref:Uncharacterized protein n=1 Tax=Acinetobacter indicus TaxID=756892 RepID=A0A6C0Y749_9GAMM|nr:MULTISPECIES: hypothetical protein [Acinetobacter]QIC72087.1 hypothetical protein FSC09_17160 [Acinetobacter indicus]QKQ71512.1 hypothetical protein E5Y90_14870 [Acinetobacter sp. 10FS3-1]